LRARAPHVSFLQEANKALRAIANVVRADELARLAESADGERRLSSAQQAAPECTPQQGSKLKLVALDEAESKALLRPYGIDTPEEELVTSLSEALSAAERIGYPVVLKAVAAHLTHKSEAGAVVLNLAAAQELTAAYERMQRSLAAHALTGMLVCAQVRGGLELVLGLHRDPEAGLVAMVGSGGVNVELLRDVAFAIPPVTPEKARHMIGRTRAGKLIAGYRGSPPLDLEAVVAALVSLGRLAIDLKDAIESVDINPYVALRRGQGALALDALVVLRTPMDSTPSPD
jgi:acetate---CoA ligase (ADP-forming)